MYNENYSIIFSSMTGNTRKLADKIHEILPKESCDYFGNADGVFTLEQYAENADACQKRDVPLPIRLFPNIHLNCSQKSRIFSEKGLIFVPNLCTMGHVSRKTFAF